MSDYTCINCGSSNITQLKNSKPLDILTLQPKALLQKEDDFIASQPLVQELITFKQQKIKQEKMEKMDLLFTHFFLFKNLQYDINTHELNTESQHNDDSYRINSQYFRIKKINKMLFLKIILSYLILSIPYIFMIVSIQSLLVSFLLSFLYLLLLFSIPPIFYNLIKDIEYRRELEEINNKIRKCFTLYYCKECKIVMDFDKQLYEPVENTNSLIKQILEM